MELFRNVQIEAIVIGASAGGLKALSELLGGLPSDFRIPIIIVQHRSKGHKDLLEEILQGKCKIRIRQAEEKERIQKGNVYIAPPDYHLLIEKDKTFSLASDEPVKFSRPSIDVLFDSAAFVFRKNLLGILLTGSNNDGTDGLQSVKSNGGITIAQSPQEAQFSFMPASAIKSSSVDLILEIEEIKKFIIELNSKLKS